MNFNKKNENYQLSYLLIFVFAFFCFIPFEPVSAVEPDEILQNRDLEKRARSISSGLRCLVCQNQSIDDSDAPLAKDLRVLVRERLSSGDTDQQVKDYVVQRYGEFVLLKPPFNRHTLLLWGSPFLICLLGFFIFWKVANSQRSNKDSDRPLSETEQKELGNILLQTQEKNTLP